MPEIDSSRKKFINRGYIMTARASMSNARLS